MPMTLGERSVKDELVDVYKLYDGIVNRLCDSGELE